MSKRLRKNAHTLKLLAEGNNKVNRAIIKDSKRDSLDSLAECSKNILEGNITISKKDKCQLHRYRHDLRRLADKRTAQRKKKQILQKGGFLPLLLAPLAASIISPVLKGALGALVGK